MEHERERVVILHLSFRPQREPENLRRVLYNLALPMAKSMTQGSDTAKQAMIQRAAQDLLEADTPPSTYNYYGANSATFHGLLFYAMRPNPRAAMSLQSIVKATLPYDFASDSSIGLPIRASDKCDVESECLQFSEYVHSLEVLPFGNEATTSIVVTTESREVIHELEKYVSGTSQRTRFVTNKRDVLQDSGFLPKVQTNYTQQDAMLSAISSLKLQMATRYTVGNCCSNFHLLLSDFLSEGCGLASNNQFLCLQDHPNPEFRICCQWDKSAECLLRRKRTFATA